MVVSTQILTPWVVIPSPHAEMTMAHRVSSAAGKTCITEARTPSAVRYPRMPNRFVIDGVQSAATAYPAPDAATTMPKPASPVPPPACSNRLRKIRIVPTIMTP